MAPGAAVLEKLARAAKPSLGEALEEAVEDYSGRLVEEAMLLRNMVRGALSSLLAQGEARLITPRPSSPAYGVDAGLARLRRGSRVVAVLHAVALGPGFERHLVRVLSLPAAGPEADAAIEAAMSLLEAAVLATVPPGGLVFLDGPLADPPWVPKGTRLLEAAAEQLLGSRSQVDALIGLHRLRAEAVKDRRVIGVVKRLTGETRLAALLGLGEAGDDVAAAALAAALREERGANAVAAIGPLPVEGEVYKPYMEAVGGVNVFYVLDARGPRGYRVEAAMGVEAVEEAAGQSMPPKWLPEPVLAAHYAAKPPVSILAAAERRAARGAAGDPVAEALMYLLAE